MNIEKYCYSLNKITQIIYNAVGRVNISPDDPQQQSQIERETTHKNEQLGLRPWQQDTIKQQNQRKGDSTAIPLGINGHIHRRNFLTYSKTKTCSIIISISNQQMKMVQKLTDHFADGWRTRRRLLLCLSRS